MSSFSNEINKITKEIQDQIKDLNIKHVATIIFKSLILAQKIKGLNENDKKEICLEVIEKLINDPNEIEPFKELIDDLLDNLVKQENISKISDRSSKCNCLENVDCNLSVLIPRLSGLKPFT